MTRDELANLLEDHQPLHSDYQIERAITAREGQTEYGCYKQAMRELDKRRRCLLAVLRNAALMHVDVDEKTHALKNGVVSTFVERRLKIGIAGLRSDIQEAARAFKEIAREADRFAGQVAFLKKKLGPMTPEKRAKLDAEMWAHKIKAHAALDLMTAGRLSRDTIELIAVAPLDAEWRKDLKDWLPKPEGDAESEAKKDALVAWFLEQKPVIVDESHSLPYAEDLKLLEG